MSGCLGKFKCRKCEEFMVFGGRLGYTYGDCQDYHCSGCRVIFDTAKSCPVRECSVRVKDVKEHNLNDAFKQEFDQKFKIPTCETHDWEKKESLCIDPGCNNGNRFECPECQSEKHGMCPKAASLTTKGLLAKSRIRVDRYREMIPLLKDRLTERQLVCPKLEEINQFIDGRILKLCSIEDQFFIDNGFRSEYDLTTEDKDILVHDKVLRQVEPLVTRLLEGWKTKSLETISAGMEEIGQLCKVQNLVVNRSVKPHVVQTKRGAPLTPLDMEEAQLARHVDLA